MTKYWEFARGGAWRNPNPTDIDGVIERHGGWPDAFPLTNINGHTPTS